ncbi:hypothetical protein DBV15_05755 [Temnothorax longispinosus]|uniref:Uncharacterized protein n=1 Tax=Temnothorax longispinosus TaxID=300112 RepID=A0A4S2KF35_9HYME|nr:hypothetical protein DBV15_05755 [Temnothorax longispinosus]
MLHRSARTLHDHLGHAFSASSLFHLARSRRRIETEATEQQRQQRSSDRPPPSPFPSHSVVATVEKGTRGGHCPDVKRVRTAARRNNRRCGQMAKRETRRRRVENRGSVSEGARERNSLESTRPIAPRRCNNGIDDFPSSIARVARGILPVKELTANHSRDIPQTVGNGRGDPQLSRWEIQKNPAHAASRDPNESRAGISFRRERARFDLSQKATQRRMARRGARGRQPSRETGFSFHEISKASRRPPGTRTGEFIKIETRHLCRELRIRRKSVLRTTRAYSSSSRRSPAKLGPRKRRFEVEQALKVNPRQLRARSKKLIRRIGALVSAFGYCAVSLNQVKVLRADRQTRTCARPLIRRTDAQLRSYLAVKFDDTGRAYGPFRAASRWGLCALILIPHPLPRVITTFFTTAIPRVEFLKNPVVYFATGMPRNNG